ncbi:MAG TPA: apolipoprotein N-acyltransferase, partial [Stenotrophobium sp.]|nr:apolipoprotein N-acyltransferase [Stenotrophobium sp.]
GFAPFGAWPLTLLALAGLFAISAGADTRRALWLGWLFGFAHFASGIYWVYISTHIYGGAPAWLGFMLAVALSGYLAIYPALVLALTARVRLHQRLAGWWTVPALWLLMELLRGWVYSGFPWLSLGAVALDTPLQKLAPLIGVHGLSAAVVLLAWALARLCAGRQPAVALAVLLSPLLCLWLPAPAQWTQATGKPMRVAIIQGDIPQDQKWLPEMKLPTLARYRQMTLAAGDADLVVWPEAAMPALHDDIADDYLAPLSARLRTQGSSLLAGMLRASDDGKKYYNTVYALGASSGRYDKRHLVPFGEYFPVPDWLLPLMDVLGVPFSNLGFGAAQQAPIKVDGQAIGIAICFEDVFPDEYRHTAAQSVMVANVTNDAWFGHSGAAAQHLAIARMRALETGREVLRASNTGVSAIIDANGRLQAQTGFFTQEILRGEAQPRSGETPYVRWGDRPLWVLSVILIGLAFML